MSLNRLRVQNIRNIQSADLELHEKLNIFVGNNGSGKTSLLEAIYFLSTGRSFRTQQLLPLVQRSEDHCLVFGEISAGARNSRLGVKRSLDGASEYRLDGKTVNRSAILAKELPLLVLGPETVDLLLGPPEGRRSFLNWGVFHVEHDFSTLWVTANRCLKQRNELLKKSSRNSEELEIWTERLVALSTSIHLSRQRYFAEFSAVFSEISRFLSGHEQVKCDYYAGWDIKRGLAIETSEHLDSDLRRGFSQRGYHRADVRVQIGGVNVAKICSRGELKLLAWALLISQGVLLGQRMLGDDTLVYLVDDLTAELDTEHRNKLCQLLTTHKGQVLVTGIDEKIVKASWGDTSGKVFHVERGMIAQTETEND